jgi:uncharacterized protein (DUF1501 family)
MLCRRQFLIRGLSAGLILPLAAGFSARAAAEGRVLVVVQLSGGNDSLNCVLPLEQERWYRERPTLSGVAAKSHRLADGLGLHPALSGLAERFRRGQVALLHGVGYPGPDRSHFRSLDIWHTGRVPGDPRGPREAQERQGWLGRAAARLTPAADPAALFVGAGQPPLAFFEGGRAPAAVAGQESLEQPGALPEALLAALEQPTGSGAQALLADASRAARQLGRLLEQAARLEPRAPWPRSGLADRLALVARSIRLGLPPRIYGVELDGFDTHLSQARPHERLLTELDGALAAFLSELESSGDLDRVAVLVWSEFGRRVHENGSGGTDHGAAAAVWLLGGAVSGGEHGQRPDLEHLEDGDVPHTTDLRTLYASLEHDWLRLTPENKKSPLTTPLTLFR